MAEQCSHYWHNGQCVLCEAWQPGEAEKIIPVWVVEMDRQKVAFDVPDDALREMDMLIAEGGNPVMVKVPMTRQRYASLGEHTGW